MASAEGETSEGLAAKLAVIFPHLDERQRRLLAAAEARSLGHGGIRTVARAAGLSEATVSDGVAELEAGEAPLGRVRRRGAGRRPLTEHDPELVPALLRLVEPEEIGDPMSPLRWTTKSLRTLSRELDEQGHRVSPAKVGQLLREQDFSLQANAKVLAGRTSPDRDEQFRYLNEQVKAHHADGDPVISVDAKKKEKLGNRASAGRTWRPAGDPVLVNDHDFPRAHDQPDDQPDGDGTGPADEPGGTSSDRADTGTVTPFGIYDLGKDTGWVNVGTDHDTAAFAVESIRRWWYDVGQVTYPRTRRLLITADAGGSNSHRARAWKTELAALALQTGLTITVCHFPPGTSKWNKIEHRLFSHITMNWRGRPLTSHHVVLQSIAATTTRTGLTVHAELDDNHYPLGATVTDRQLAALPLTRHDWHGDWNYTVHPTPATPTPTTDTSTPRSRPDPATPNWLTHPALTGIPATDWDALVTIMTALDNDRPRPDRRHHPLLLPITARLTATLVNHHTRLPLPALGQLYRVHQRALHARETRALLQQIGHLPRRGPHRLANLQDLYDIAALEGITHPDTRT